MRHAFRALIFAMAATLAVASCTEKEPEIINDTREDARTVCLKISDVTATDLTKSAVKGTSFPTDEDVSIGIFVRETEGHTGSEGGMEYNWPYENVKCTRAAGQTQWVMSKDIELDEKSVIVYAYYPWKDGIGWDHIDVYPSVDGDDWMWATPIENVSSANPDIKLTMNHALAMVEITFNVSNHSEDAKMTNISVSSAGAARYSGFSFRGGTHFPYGTMTGDNTLSKNVDYSLKDGVIKADCLLVPAMSGTSANVRQSMTISCTLADKTYTANLSGSSGVIIKQGTKSTVSLNVKGTTMEVASVGVSGWNSGATTANVGGHSVTVTGGVPASITPVTNIITDGDVIESGSLTGTIRYDKSFLNGGVCDLVYSVEAGACKIAHNAEEGILTVSDVTKDIEIALSTKVAEWDEVPSVSGTFTVDGSGRKVRFSSGLLYWDGDSFEIESDQLSFSGYWNASHVSHFFWSKDPAVSCQEKYSDPNATTGDVLFTNSTETDANPAFTAVELKGIWRALSNAEWNYLINTRTVNGETGEGHTCKETTVNGRTGLIIFCDGYTGETKNLTSIPEGCAFLPISGYRSEAEINGLNLYGYCWSSTPVSSTQAYCLNFKESVKTSVNNNRNYGFPIRLVIDETE